MAETYPHTTSGYVDGGVRCSCGATWTKACHFGPPPGKTWGRDCPLALREALAWHEERHGTRDDQEADDAETEAELAAIDALSDEQVRAMNEAEGIDTPAERKRFDVFLRVLTRETIAKANLADVTAERDRLRAILDAELGKRGPEGWTWDGSGWTRDNAIGEVLFVTGRGLDRRPFRRWEWYWQNVSGRAETALEALEAADLAAKEAK